jgi:ABC-type branched-subunit amino acid transport system permease subunit
VKGDYLAIVTLGFRDRHILFINLDRPINITNGVNGIPKNPPGSSGSPWDNP